MPVTLSSSDLNDRSPELRSPLLSPTRKTAGEPESEKLCIDDMLQKYCGQFGPWQIRHFVLTSLAWALEAFHTMVMIFADREPDWRCLGGAAGSGCDVTARTVCGLEPGLVLRWLYDWCGTFWPPFRFIPRKKRLPNRCMHLEHHFRLPNSFLPKLLDLRPPPPPYRLQHWRRRPLRLCPRHRAGGPTKRGMAGMSTFYFFSTGIAILSGIAYIFPQWRELYIASSIPSLLFLLAVLPFVSESPRWYLVRGRITEATKLMRAIANSNNKHLPEGVVLTLDEEANNDSPTTNEEDQTYKELLDSKDAISGSLIDVVKLPMTRMRLFLAVAINFLCSVVYYGLSLNVVNLETNLYINVLLNAVAEMPAFTITAVLLDKYGRKPLAIGTLWFSGVFCFAGSFVGNAGVWKVVKMVCGILGIFGMAGTYNLLFIYTTELFPTVVRNAALGCATQAAQMGAILSPFVVVLGGGLPFAVFAVCGIAGGVFAFYLPETLNKPLYDTMAGMEDGEGACRSVN
ncbi:organic cation/carnitine transporter 4 [Prunus yedoensis var. nudiflora]|uniref:Organic cation/carnitine transporter 4 n=1 Tax=Prunus yedoensis var. nudiflora TaxID=2094558 RepID=A0A314YSZ9_PRUYE|nr:organic cation/carnitine transporter 4 [Prunus yedoensis var. nudiflora]